jgi:hypothetical protein
VNSNPGINLNKEKCRLAHGVPAYDLDLEKEGPLYEF